MNGAQVDTEGGPDGTVIWVVAVPGQVDLLTIFLVLLLPPYESNVVDVLD